MTINQIGVTMSRINPITSNNHHQMWCMYGVESHNGSAVNRVSELRGNVSFSKCLGKLCPAIIITTERDNEWIGYCGRIHRTPVGN
jgi:hypothetical protein